MPISAQRCLLLTQVLAVASGHAFAASDYLRQTKPGDTVFELASKMEASGCTITEEEIFGILGALGVDAQSVIKDLAQSGDIRWDKADSYTLVGWGKCR